MRNNACLFRTQGVELPGSVLADISPAERGHDVGGYLQAERGRVPSCSCSGFRHHGMTVPLMLTL